MPLYKFKGIIMDIKQKVKDFLDKELVDFTNFRYDYEIDEEGYLYVHFLEVFGEESQKEITFKIIKDNLYLHSTSFGWKAVEKGSANKFLWIELAKEF